MSLYVRACTTRRFVLSENDPRSDPVVLWLVSVIRYMLFLSIAIKFPCGQHGFGRQIVASDER